jgi:hypothetical protein
VACISSVTCAAVGSARPEGSDVPSALAEAWSSGRWTLATTPRPVGKTLNQVSCSGPAVCFAVGSVTTPVNVQLPLVERSP